MEPDGDGAVAEAAAHLFQEVIGARRPQPAVMEIDGALWRRARQSDGEALDRLAALGDNRRIFNLPRSSAEFESAVGRGGFRQPMVCTREGVEIGGAATTNHDHRSLNVRLLCFFSDPGAATRPLGAYVRHVFWSTPVHRIYMQLPQLGGAGDYVSLACRVGFVEEGTVRAYALVDGRPRDVAALGLLRKEFVAWCEKNEPRLSL
jgi:hypothetical protein